MPPRPPRLPVLSDYVHLYATERGGTTALADDASRITYAELPAAVDAWAGALAAAGVGAGDVVGVLGNSRTECFLAYLSCCRTGSVYLGLSPKHTAEELGVVVSDARPRLLVGVHDEAAEKLQDVTGRLEVPPRVVTSSTLDAFLGATTHVSASNANADDPCALVYTSGSTGAPKGALLSQRGIIRSALLSLQTWCAVDTELRTVAQHPIDHVGWLVCECVTALLAGGSVFFRERFDGAETLRLVERERLTLWIAFPAMVLLAMESDTWDDCDLSSLERVAFGTSPPVELLSRLRRRTGAGFSVSYGLTEAGGGAVTATGPGADFASLAETIGRPVEGVELRVVDEHGAAVASGEVGELLVRDECVFLGYLGRPDATAAALDGHGWLRTGDLVVQQLDGTFRLAGRLREMFKSGGYNVYPAEVEGVIASHESVSAAVVVRAPDPVWTEVGVAFVVLRPGAVVGEQELREFARSRLANYKVPKRFEVTAELPQLPNGKFDRVKLREHAAQLVAA